MPYEIHAYCTSQTPPTVREILTWLRDDEAGWRAEADAPGTGAKGLESPRWAEFELHYGRNGSPTESLVLGCHRNTAPQSTCAKMVRGRLEPVVGYNDSPGRKRVLDCWARTRFIVWCRVDNDPDRERASPVLDLLASLLDPHGPVLDLEDEGSWPIRTPRCAGGAPMTNRLTRALRSRSKSSANKPLLGTLGAISALFTLRDSGPQRPRA